MPSMEFHLVHSAVESQNSCGGAVESTDGVDKGCVHDARGASFVDVSHS